MAKKKYYDLSVPVGDWTPDWMGHHFAEDTCLQRVHRHEIPIEPGLSRQVSEYIGIWHKGTHIDGPTHHEEGAATCDKIPLDRFYGTGVIVDFRYMKKWQIVTAKDLEKAKPKIEEGDIVLMNTGWHHYWRVNDYVYYNHYPGLYTEAGEWLLAKKIKMVGGTWGATDGPLCHYPLRIDNLYHGLWDEYMQETGKDADKEFPDYEPCHQMFSSNMIPAIENLGGEIDEVTGMRCTIAAFPYRFADPGHMVRVVAIVDK